MSILVTSVPPSGAAPGATPSSAAPGIPPGVAPAGAPEEASGGASGQSGTPQGSVTETASSAPVAAAGRTEAAASATESSAVAADQMLTAARQDAAARPGGLGPLMADLPQVADADLPPTVQTAVQQILDLRLPATVAPSGDDIARAFAQSGLFTEARFAALAGDETASAAPLDLKSLILVLQQALRGTLTADSAAPTTATSPETAPETAPYGGSAAVPNATGTATGAMAEAETDMGGAPGATLVANLAANLGTTASAAQAQPQVSGQSLEPGSAQSQAQTQTQAQPQTQAQAQTQAQTQTQNSVQSSVPAQAAAGSDPSVYFPQVQVALPAASGADATVPMGASEASGATGATGALGASGAPSATAGASAEISSAASGAATHPTADPTAEPNSGAGSSTPTGSPSSSSAAPANLPPGGYGTLLAQIYGAADPADADDDTALLTRALQSGTAVPPPFAGGATAAQAAATSQLSKDADIDSIVRYLLFDSEAALSHQKLLQFASLPDSGASGARGSASPHWMFEIPLATGQGTAVAQFAIDRDGGGQDGTRQGVVWRVRFSVDVEPLGPVHVGLALSGAKTWVTLWASRKESMQALRAGADDLAESLKTADLEAEIAFAPVPAPQAKPSAPGHFLDRTS